MPSLRIIPAGLRWDEERECFLLRLSKDKSKHHCQVKFCRNDAALHNNGRRKICHKCRSRLYRANNPEIDAYHHLKDSAGKRDIRFTLTLEQFKLVIAGTDYLTKRGRSPGHLQIDRKRAEAGYEFGNLRVIEATHNGGKGVLERNGHCLPEEDFEEGDPF